MKITNAAGLKEAIALLQIEEAAKKEILINQFHVAHESLKPANLIRNVFNKVINSPDIAGNVVDASIGLGAGALSKRILVGKPTNFFKRILGTAIQLTVANAVTKNSDGIKKRGVELIKKLIK
jgi:hypothetical protein